MKFVGSAVGSKGKMASTATESSSELNQLFRDISLKLSPAESEDVVQSIKRIYGKEFKSLGNQDLFPCLDLLHKFSYVSSSNLRLMKFIADKSKRKQEIYETTEKCKEYLSSKVKSEKELQGRGDEIKKITERLTVRGKATVVNLYGSAGVGKTTLAKEICKRWEEEDGKYFVFDLRKATEMKAVYVNIMGTLKLKFPVGVSWKLDYVVKRIHQNIKKISAGQPVLFLLDNVEQFTEGKGKEGKNLRTQFILFLQELSQFEDEASTLNMLLTSRTQLKDSEKVIDHELQPLSDSFSEKILLPEENSDVEAQQKKMLLGVCKGVPLFLKGTAAILKQKRKSPSDLIKVIELSSQEETGIPMKSKSEEDSEEKPFDFQEDGIDEGQLSIMKEMFDTLPSDTLRVSAVSMSLFHGPFSAPTAAKILGVSASEAVAQLEGLVTNAVTQHVVVEDTKDLMYDIHPLLRKYAESIKNDVQFFESYTKAERRFHEHFMSKMKRLAGFIESNYVRAFNEFARDRPNFEFAIEISLLPEYFSVPGGYHENAVIASLFNAMLSGKKQAELFHSWAEVCKDDGNLGSLFRAQLRCWEARLVLETQGTHKAFEVLEKASMSLKQVQDQSTESFKLTKGLFQYIEGEVYYQNRDYKSAIESLQSSLGLMEEPLKLDTIVARCYNALGNCFYRINKLEKALEFYNKALTMRKELSGSEDHYDMPVYKNQIGIVHEHKGEYDMAVECYEEALRLLEKLDLLGYEDEALFCRNLANVLMYQKKYLKAVEPAEKAYNIRQNRLETHRETVRSIFQLGVLQANLRAFKKALAFFLKTWEMEQKLGAGNQSEVWRLIIKGVFDMYDNLKTKDSEREKFRQDALAFCKRFWKGERDSEKFSFTKYNKEIIDTILDLLGNKTKDRALRDEYEKDAVWFYDGMQRATEADFFEEFDQETDNKVLNEMLRERTAFLERLIDLCGRRDEHEKRLEHKQGKMKLFKKVLVRFDFVGERKQEKSTLKEAVEKLYKDIGEKNSIKKFQDNLLATWQRQWEEGKSVEESKVNLVARERMIKGILQLCEELKRKDLRKRYKKEDLNFRERLWEIQYPEMGPSVMKKFLNEIKELASSIGETERVKIYLAALKDLREKKQSSASLRPKVLQVQMSSLLEKSSSDSGEEEEEEVEAEGDVEAVTAEASGTESSEEVITVGSEEDIVTLSVQEVEGGSQEMIVSGPEEEVGLESEDGTPVKNDYIVVIKDKVSKQGTHWNLKQVAAHVTFPPDAVSEDKTVTVLRWNSSVCSPPLNDNEALVSGIIELSTHSAQGFEFNKAVTLVISHCAADIKGYEVVAKMLIDRDTNEWSDISETVHMRSLADIPASSSGIPDYFLPVAEFKVTQCSTFAVVCRLKSNEFTLTSEGKVLSFPEHPLFNVSIPENAVQKGEEHHIVVKLQEIHQKEFKGKDVWAGPILRITSPDTLQFQQPVTIQLPLSLREESCPAPDMSTCRVRIFFQESTSEHQEWTDITDRLVTPASCDGMVFEFRVTHFSVFWCWLEWCAQPMVWLREAMSRDTRLIRKAAFFAAYVSKDTRLNTNTNLRLFCSPVNERGKLHDDESRLGNVWLGDECSMEPMNPEDRAYVFLSGDVVRTLKPGKFVRFPDQAYNWTNVPVYVMRRGALTVEFCSSRDRDEDNLLCEMEVTVPPQQRDPDKTPIEFFGLPFHDETLHCANLTGVDGMLTACSSVLQDIGKRRIYDDHLSLPPTGETKESFFRELAKLAPEDQEKCFRRIVTTLDDSEGDVEHVKNHLLNAYKKVNEPPSDSVCLVVADKVKVEWKTFASYLGLPQRVIENIAEEEKRNGNLFQCRKALSEWYEKNGSKATNREIMRCLTNMGYANVNWHIMRELGLVSTDNIPESER